MTFLSIPLRAARPDPAVMVYIHSIPLEILYMIVGVLLREGFHGSAVSLARTINHFYSRVTPEVYKYAIVKKTFFIAHWATKRGLMSTLQRGIEHGADVNQPFTSCKSFDVQEYDLETEKVNQRTNYGKVQTEPLYGKRLDQAVLKHCSSAFERHYWTSLWAQNLYI